MDRFTARSFSLLPVGTRVLVVTSPAMVRALLRRHFASDQEKLEGIDQGMLGILDAAQANKVLGVVTGGVTEIAEEPNGYGLFRSNVQVSDPVSLAIETEDRLTTALGGPLREHAGMPAVPAQLDGDGLLAMFAAGVGMKEEDFVKDHPWFRRVGFTGDERSAYLYQLGDIELSTELEKMQKAGKLEEWANNIPGLVEKLEATEGDDEKVVNLLIEAMRQNIFQKPAESLQLIFLDSPENRRWLEEVFGRFIDATTNHRAKLQRDYAGYL